MKLGTRSISLFVYPAFSYLVVDSCKGWTTAVPDSEFQTGQALSFALQKKTDQALGFVFQMGFECQTGESELQTCVVAYL